MGRVSDAQKVFSNIYRDNIWGKGSGVGSLPEYTAAYRSLVQTFLRDNKIQSVVDFGCGDWQFSKLIDWGEIDYQGFDVVESVILENQRAFGRKNIRFQVLNDSSALPPADLLICKDVLQHLPIDDIKHYLAVFRRLYRHMLITNDVYPDRTTNTEIEHGAWRGIRLDRRPFNENLAVLLKWDVTAYGQHWVKHTCHLTGNPDAQRIALPQKQLRLGADPHPVRRLLKVAERRFVRSLRSLAQAWPLLGRILRKTRSVLRGHGQGAD